MPTSADWLRILPEIVLLIFAGGVLTGEVFLGEKRVSAAPWAAIIGSLISLCTLVPVWWNPGPAFLGMLDVDRFSLAVKVALLVNLGLSSLISIGYLRRERLEHGEYYALLMLSTVGMMLLASSSNLIMVFLSLEVLSIALYILAGFARTEPRSEEAALKYFLLGSFASAFLLYGAALMYGASGTLNLAAFGSAIGGTPGTLIRSPAGPLLLAGVALMLVGLGFKIAVVPFQMWTPDVYEGAPTTVTAFMSVGAKAAGFAALARFLVLTLPGLRQDVLGAIWAIAAATMAVGNIAAVVQENIKRMLAYSSIAHAGYILIAVASANDAAISSIPFYLLVYGLMNIGAFTVAYLVAGRGDRNLRIEDYSGLFYERPWLAVSMAIFMFGLAGLPPTGGFMAKFYVFAAAVKANLIGLVVVGVVTTLISVYYYIRVTVMMFMNPPKHNGLVSPGERGASDDGLGNSPPETADEEHGRMVSHSRIDVPATAATALIIAAVVTLLLGIFPNPLIRLSELAVR